MHNLLGSCLKRGENSLENTLRPPSLHFPPFPFPYQRLPRRIHDSGGSFQARQFKFIPTFRHTRCRNQHYYLSNSHYSAILCLVWDLFHSHRTAKVENIHCYIIYHSHSPTKSEHICKFRIT